jgi:hypothetical protein
MHALHLASIVGPDKFVWRIDEAPRLAGLTARSSREGRCPRFQVVATARAEGLLHPDRRADQQTPLRPRAPHLQPQVPQPFRHELEIVGLAHADDLCRGPERLRLRRDGSAVLGQRAPASHQGVGSVSPLISNGTGSVGLLRYLADLTTKTRSSPGSAGVVSRTTSAPTNPARCCRGEPLLLVARPCATRAGPLPWAPRIGYALRSAEVPVAIRAPHAFVRRIPENQ